VNGREAARCGEWAQHFKMLLVSILTSASRAPSAIAELLVII